VVIWTADQYADSDNLLCELRHQTLQPDAVVLVSPRDSLRLAEKRGDLGTRWMLTEIRASYRSASYIWFLGWRAVRDFDVVVYLEAGISLPEVNALQTLVEPIGWDHRYITASTAMVREAGRNEVFGGVRGRPAGFGRLTRRFRVPGTLPGDLTPAGRRTLPDHLAEYTRVGWVDMRAMACRTRSLTESCFTEVMFAFGAMGAVELEEAFLGRRLQLRGGEMVLVKACPVRHTQTEKLGDARAARCRGYAEAFGQRYFNDYYRGGDWPPRSDRFRLLLDYGVTLLCRLTETAKAPSRYRLWYCWGYLLGIVKAVRVRPDNSGIGACVPWRESASSDLALGWRSRHREVTR
jgi:hypothetical protein